MAVVGLVWAGAVAGFFGLLTFTPLEVPEGEACGMGAVPPAPIRRFYVDSASPAASDDNPGTSAEAPLATLAAVGRLALEPGDWVGFAAGSRYRGEITLAWSGTAEHPIVLSSYGEGPRPVIGGEGPDTIRVAGGRWLVLEDLVLEGAEDSAVVLDVASRSVTVQRVVVRGAGRAVQVDGADHRLLANDISDLHMVRNTPGGDDDSGAQAFVVSGSGHVFLCNRARNARAESFDYGIDGTAFEFWRSASDIIIRWNRVENSAGFFEVGGLEGDRLERVVVSDNVAIDAAPFHWIHNRPGQGNFGVTVTGLVLERNVILDRWSRGPILGFGAAPAPGSYRFECNLVIAPVASRLFSFGGDYHTGNEYIAFPPPDGPGERVVSPLLAIVRFAELRRRLARRAGEAGEACPASPRSEP